MSPMYPHLLSPFKIGNIVFKNRLTATPSKPYFLQSPDRYPTEALITTWANRAKNGAGLVTCSTGGRHHWIYDEKPKKYVTSRSISGHYDVYEPFDPHYQHMLSQLSEAIHFYGSKASMQVVLEPARKWDVSTGIPSMIIPNDGGVSTLGEEIPADMLDEIAEDYALHALALRDCGFDMIFLLMGYRAILLGRFLSPLTNKRTDQFGGSLENRARFPIMVADRIKQKCGKDFLIEASISGIEPQGGLTQEETIKLARMFAGHFDLLHIKTGDVDTTQPIYFNLERNRPPFLSMAEAIKKSNPGVAILTVGAYLDPDISEEVIASGKADFIGMARAWISNPEYGRLLYEGRKEDIVPCLRCQNCHVSSWSHAYTSVCAVNPVWGLEHKIERIIDPPTGKKKVAVIGGGPAGLEAALIAAKRGHQVTLYEKSNALGGLIKTADGVSFKWLLKDFKNYLIRQVAKAGIKVYLNTEATPEKLKHEKYDAIVAAVGSDPIVPPISGIKGKNVIFAEEVYGKENTLAKKVVVVGGGEVGVETAMHLAEKGHQVTVLEMGDMLAPSAPPIHYYSMLKTAWEKLENFSSIVRARCTGIENDKVFYEDAEGNKHTIEAGSVVLSVGVKPKNDLAMQFYGVADRFYMIGDCEIAGNVQKAMRSAFSAASTI